MSDSDYDSDSDRRSHWKRRAEKTEKKEKAEPRKPELPTSKPPQKRNQNHAEENYRKSEKTPFWSEKITWIGEENLGLDCKTKNDFVL